MLEERCGDTPTEVPLASYGGSIDRRPELKRIAILESREDTTPVESLRRATGAKVGFLGEFEKIRLDGRIQAHNRNERYQLYTGV